MGKANPAAAARPKNWLLIQIRTWHSWLGVFLFPLIILAAVTGIYLNHKDLFERKPEARAGERGGGGGGAMKERKEKPAKATPASSAGFTVDGALSAPAVSFAEALSAAKPHLGDAALEKVELKNEKGTLVYKVKAADEREVIVDASSGRATLKGGYAKVTGAGGADGSHMETSTDWGKLMKDLHTGKVGGTPGKLVVDFVALTLVLLSLSGLYLWAVPILRKRQNAKSARAAAGAAAGIGATPATA